MVNSHPVSLSNGVELAPPSKEYRESEHPLLKPPYRRVYLEITLGLVEDLLIKAKKLESSFLKDINTISTVTLLLDKNAVDKSYIKLLLAEYRNTVRLVKDLERQQKQLQQLIAECP